jgi:hypothetical protein
VGSPPLGQKLISARQEYPGDRDGGDKGDLEAGRIALNSRGCDPGPVDAAGHAWGIYEQLAKAPQV